MSGAGFRTGAGAGSGSSSKVESKASLIPLKNARPDERTLDFYFFKLLDPEYLNRASAKLAEIASAKEAQPDDDFDEDDEVEFFPVRAGAGVPAKDSQRMSQAPGNGNGSGVKRDLEDYSGKEKQARKKMRTPAGFTSLFEAAEEVVPLINQTSSATKSNESDEAFNELIELFEPRPSTP